MPNILNLPTKEQFDRMNTILQQIADDNRVVHDYTNSPGSKVLIRGDANAGFYGFVQPEDMGKIIIGGSEEDYNGANLALAIGLSTGTAFNSNIPLMKFAYKGKTIFIPLTGYRYSVPWDKIYEAGVVYASEDEGFLPPTGRCGTDLSIDASDNSINTTTQRFLGDKSSDMDYADTVGTVGDKLVLKGWTNNENNVTVTIESITNTKIIVSGATLKSEQGGKTSRFYNEAKKVNQGKTVKIGDKTYRVYLMKGAGANPTDTYSDIDRGAAGPDNMWNSLILPLHEHAKLGNWNYPQYAVDANGNKITSDWNIGLTDENLRTHYIYGSGNYTWCQEVQDLTTWRRVLRGNRGASSLGSSHSLYVNTHYCWRPVLESL